MIFLFFNNICIRYLWRSQHSFSSSTFSSGPASASSSVSILTIPVSQALSTVSSSENSQPSSGTSPITQCFHPTCVRLESPKHVRRHKTLRNVNKPPNSPNILPFDFSRRVPIMLTHRFSCYLYYGIAKHMPNKYVSLF